MIVSSDVRLVIEGVIVIAAVAVTWAAVAAYSRLRARMPMPDAVASLSNTVDKLSDRITELEQQRSRDHATIRSHSETIMTTLVEVEKWKSYSRLLAALLDGAGEDVPPAPDAVAIAKPRLAADDRKLYQAVAKLFSLDEIDDLAFQLEVNVDELEGTTAAKRARSLVMYARRRGILEELSELVRRLRPESDV